MSERNNPFVLVDAAVVAVALASIRGNAHAAQAMRAEAEGIIDTALTELGDMSESMDLDRVKSIRGGHGEKVEAIVAAHSRLAAANQALAEVRDIRGSAAWRERQFGEGDAEHVERVMLGAEPLPTFGAMLETAQGGNLEFPQGREVRAYEVPGGFNALFQTSDGLGRDVRRGPQIGLAANVLRPRIVDAFGPAIQTDQGAIKFIRETVTASAAEEVAEGAKEKEMDLSYPDVTLAMSTIRADIPVTQEQLDDVPQARAILDRRMGAIARARFDRQITVGDGTGANISGLVTQAGQTRMFTSKATGPDFGQVLGGVRHGMRLVETSGDYMANAIILNDLIWSDMQLAQTNGIYTLGSPALSPQPNLWGITVYDTPNLEDGRTDGEISGVVADLAVAADLYYKQDVVVEAGWMADDFGRYQIRLRVVMRALLALYATHAAVKLEANI